MVVACYYAAMSLVSPDDYGTTTVMLTFSSTSSMECVTVPIVNDETVEGSQDFSIMFAINNDTMLGTDTAMLERESTTVTIEDNDGENEQVYTSLY